MNVMPEASGLEMRDVKKRAKRRQSRVRRMGRRGVPWEGTKGGREGDVPGSNNGVGVDRSQSV